MLSCLLLFNESESDSLGVPRAMYVDIAALP